MNTGIKKIVFISSITLAMTLAGAGFVPVAFGTSDTKESAKNAQKEPKAYPLTTCIVTDNDLGSMGEETSIVYEGQVIKFCCAPCERKFLKNPAKYLAKLDPKSAK